MLSARAEDTYQCQWHVIWVKLWSVGSAVYVWLILTGTLYIWPLYVWHSFQCHKTNSLKVKSFIWEPLFSTTSVTKNDFMKPLSGKICISPGLPVTNICVCSKNTRSSHGGQWQDLGGKVTQKLLQIGNIWAWNALMSKEVGKQLK